MVTERANPKIEEERKAAGNAKAILGWLTPSNARRHSIHLPPDPRPPPAIYVSNSRVSRYGSQVYGPDTVATADAISP